MLERVHGKRTFHSQFGRRCIIRYFCCILSCIIDLSLCQGQLVYSTISRDLCTFVRLDFFAIFEPFDLLPWFGHFTFKGHCLVLCTLNVLQRYGELERGFCTKSKREGLRVQPRYKEIWSTYTESVLYMRSIFERNICMVCTLCRHLQTTHIQHHYMLVSPRSRS